jgi:amidase
VAIDIEGYQANEYLLSRLDRLAPHNQRAMTEAARITAEEAAEAARARQDLRDWFAAALDRHPVLALPTLTGAPPVRGERGMSLTVLTVPANLAGLPALSLPVPGGPAGLPASLQLIGPPGGEERLIALGRMIEAALAR